MSASIRPTLYPSLPSETARFTATVVLPTPPLPLPTAITYSTPGRGCGPCGAPAPVCPIYISRFLVPALKMPAFTERRPHLALPRRLFSAHLAPSSCILKSSLLVLRNRHHLRNGDSLSIPVHRHI